MKKKTAIIVLAIVFVILVLPRVILWTVFSVIGKGPKSPTTSEYIGAKWVCEEPYIWFETCYGPDIGELENDDGERIPVRFRFVSNEQTCYIYRESAFWETDEDGNLRGIDPREDPVLECSYELRKKNTVLTLYVSPDNELYHDKYASLTFYRQDPAGTEESAAQP